MSNSKKFIRIKEEKIFLNDTDFILFSNTNLPKQSLSFKTNQEIIWEVKSTSFDKSNKTIHLEVLDYHPQDTTSFSSQGVNSVIERIEFQKLAWSQLEPFLSYYRKLDLMQLCKEEEENSHQQAPQKKHQTQPPNFNLDFSTTSADIPKRYHEVFNFSFSNVEFHDGYISFSELFKFFSAPIEFKIFNPHLLKEFEYIKSYFPKVLGIKKFTVLAEVELTGFRITDRKATSPHIDLIDENFIGKINRRRVLNFPKIKSDLGGSIFDLDELITSSDIPNLNSLPNQAEVNVIKIFLEEREIRNQKQIEFLAFEKQSPKEKIKFNLKPRFGFIFSLEGKFKFYCWELLNHNATYICGLKNQNSSLNLFETVEEEISLIAKIGRKEYRSYYKENSLNLEYTFHALHHSKVNVNPEIGFENWKDNLEGLLKSDLQ